MIKCQKLLTGFLNLIYPYALNLQSFVLKEQERHVEEGRDQIGSSSTALLGYGADTGKQTCQTDALSVTNAAVMDSTPAAFQSAEATADSVGGTKL